MIAPQDLKKSDFTKSIRGYEVGEVDEYIAFLLEKYGEVYAQSDSFERKLRMIAQRIEEIQSEEEAVKRMTMATKKMCDEMVANAKVDAENIIAEADREADRIKAEAAKLMQTKYEEISEKINQQTLAAEKKSDGLLQATREHCASVLIEFKKEIETQKRSVADMRRAAEDFNSALFNMYKEHISFINIGLPGLSSETEEPFRSDLLDRLMGEIKNDAMMLADLDNDDKVVFEDDLSELKSDIERVTKSESPKIDFAVKIEEPEEEAPVEDSPPAETTAVFNAVSAADAARSAQTGKFIVNEAKNPDEASFDSTYDSDDYEDDEEETDLTEASEEIEEEDDSPRDDYEDEEDGEDGDGSVITFANEDYDEDDEEESDKNKKGGLFSRLLGGKKKSGRDEDEDYYGLTDMKKKK